MSGEYLDGDTIALSHQFLRDGGTLEALAGKLHFQDTEMLERLLGLPASKPTNMVEQPADYLWSVDRLQAQL